LYRDTETFFKNRPIIALLSEKGHKSHDNLVVKIAPWGPTIKNMNSFTSKLLTRPRVNSYLKSIGSEAIGSKNKHAVRLLSFELIPETAGTKRGTSTSPKLYLAKYYDYEHNCSLIVKGKLDQPNPTEIVESKQQPLPNNEEFEEAVKILSEQEPSIGEAIKNEILKPYRPMPPLLIQETLDGDIERTLCIGLQVTNPNTNSTSNSKFRHEILAVNMIHKSVTRFDDNNSRAPSNSRAEESLCGSPYAGQDTADRGLAGSAKVRITQGNRLLWDFIVTRPAASSGTNGSGIELQNVNYKGKRVFRRANVPILNVQYDQEACGPYRDWQYQESMIEADGDDVAPGFRLCPFPAKTILATGNDLGNFLGVGVYVDGQQGGGGEVVFVSEMEAGWYRYISEWRFHANGTVKPRFGFAAVTNSCVCNPHHHHVYWRLNFDVDDSKKNVIEEYNNPPISGSSNWHVIRYETKRMRNPSNNRKWRIKKQQTDKGYEIVPGSNDGIADTFGKGDIWFLRNRTNQFDDGVEAIGPPYEAQIDNFVNHERIKNEDIVVWYGAHFTHITTHDHDDDATGHIVGPDLIPINLE
jgi:hypothetical protein